MLQKRVHLHTLPPFTIGVRLPFYRAFLFFMGKKTMPFLLIIGLFTACNKNEPRKTETILALQNLQQLATVEYTVTKVVKGTDEASWYQFGDRKILITCRANLKAGIDLSALGPEQVKISGNQIRIQLPEPQLLTVNIPPDQIKVAYTNVGLLRSNFTNAERDALMVQAEKQIRGAVNELGIINQAKINTQLFLNDFLTKAGFQQVELIYGEKLTPVGKDE